MGRYRCALKFSLLYHFVTLLSLMRNTEVLNALYYHINNNPSNEMGSIKPHNYKRILTDSYRALLNQRFTVRSFYGLVTITCLLWLECLLLQAGDVHPNPGPSLTPSESSVSSISSVSVSSYLNITHHLSFLHLNVQSIFPKLDLLTAELSDFGHLGLF